MRLTDQARQIRRAWPALRIFKHVYGPRLGSQVRSMRCLALTDIPNGIAAGREFDCTDDEYKVLALVGAARPAGVPEPKRPEHKPRNKGAYSRRDMVAGEHTEAPAAASTTSDDQAEE